MQYFAENRRARFDYEIEETIEAGIELKGYEVKSIKAGHFNLAGSYAVVRDGEAWLLNSNIPAYQPGNTPKDYDPGRTRRLLLKRDEIKALIGKLEGKAHSLVPLYAYPKKSLIKVALGLARSRKKKDKREVLKKRAMERDIGRRL